MAIFTVVPMVTKRSHMLVCCVLCMEHFPACLTWNFGSPMPKCVYMLICCILRLKHSWAHLALKGLCPVIFVVHVLVTSPLGTKGTGAGLAFIHLDGDNQGDDFHKSG